jgi:outer membrane protein OmpA-like peptidoglycan-associated protein
MGGKDLFMSRKTDTTWSEPVNLGYPINSTVDDNSVTVTLDGKKIYWSSDRDSVTGNYDLYEMYLPEALRPGAVSYVKGYVYDSLSKEKLNYASILVNDAANGRNLYHFLSNRGDGSFMITLQVGKKYSYQVSRMGYNDINDTILFNTQHLQNAYEKNIVMLPQDYIAPIKDSMVLTVYFPLNSARLTDSDKAFISKLMEPWAYEKGIIIYINGYTDNTGTPLHNEQLSTLRANLVMQEIKKKGFDDLMIKTRGWGELSNAADNNTEESRNKNRRVDVMIRR